MTELEIQAFLSVVKYGSVTAAAEQLYVTQPALSRRLTVLEQEVGVRLLERRKGTRAAALTDEGQAFLPLAEKWQRVFEETRQLRTAGQVFRLASIGSVSAYLLPPVLRRFLRDAPDWRLEFSQTHSAEAYRLMEDGQLDCALISDPQFSRRAEAMPVFREKMVLVGRGLPAGPVSPAALPPQREIRLPWCPSFERWHDEWFAAGPGPRVLVDQMSLLEDFFAEEGVWAVAPATAAAALCRLPGLTETALTEPPEDRILYCLSPKTPKRAPRDRFLSALRDRLSELPVESFL